MQWVDIFLKVVKSFPKMALTNLFHVTLISESFVGGKCKIEFEFDFKVRKFETTRNTTSKTVLRNFLCCKILNPIAPLNNDSPYKTSLLLKSAKLTRLKLISLLFQIHGTPLLSVI